MNPINLSPEITLSLSTTPNSEQRKKTHTVQLDNR